VPSYAVKKLNDFERIYGGAMRRVRAGLGVTSFGLSTIDLPSNLTGYPEHDHAEDGQEEVYTALSGRATITIDGTDHVLEPGVFARVGPGIARKLSTGDERARILVIGGVPGAVYEPPSRSKEGERDPLTGGAPIPPGAKT
jgi:Cupin domain